MESTRIALTAKEAAEQANVHIETLRNWITHHGLPARRIGGRFYIDPIRFREWLVGDEAQS